MIHIGVFYSLLFNVPVFIVNELNAPDGAAVLDERSRHAADIRDGRIEGIYDICIHIGPKAKDLVLFLEQNGMIVRGLTSFGLPEHIRVTLGKREENELLVSLVKKWKAEN